MEIKQYLYLLRKWAWLLVLGLVLGAGGAYVFSARQPQVFQTLTKVMVMRSPEDSGSNYYVYNDIQLARTYSQMITTSPVLDLVSQELGYQVKANQISVRNVSDSLLLEITVKDGDPLRAADIANTLIATFIKYNDTLQTERFSASEQSLQAQIDQVQEQMDTLQAQMSSMTEETIRTQQAQVEERIAGLDQDIAAIKDEIEALLPPTPTPTLAPLAGVSRWATATPTPIPTPTFNAAELAAYREKQDLLQQKQNRLNELQSTRNLYQEVYLNLLVFGEANPNTDNVARQNQMQATLALYQQIYSNLVNSYENIRLARLRSTSNVVQIEPALIPISPIQPQPLRNSGLGAATGLLIMGAIAFLIEYLDDTLKTPEDVTQALGIPVIGLIAEMDRPRGKNKQVGAYVSKNPRSPVAEAFRTLRTNLEFASVDKPLKTLLVTSSSPSEGKTTLAINLAAVLAQGNRKVILLDADLRRPAIHRYLQIPNRSGLTEIFRYQGEDAPASSAPLIAWGEPPLNVITSGALPPNPSELLGSGKMDRILDGLKEMADIIIIDGPPFIVADPVVLSSKVDGVLVVIEPGSTKIDAAQAMLEQLNRAGVRVVGAVLNPISRKRLHYYGKYRYYSDYYYSRHNHYGYYIDDASSSQRPRNGSKPEPEESAAPAD